MKVFLLTFLTAVSVSFPLSAATTGSGASLSSFEKPDSSAIALLRANAERGLPLAQYNLGIAYAEGRQTSLNPVEAFVWLTLAAEGGTAGKALDSVSESLTAEQLAAARQRLESLRRIIPNLRSSAVAIAPKEPSDAAVPAGLTAAGAPVIAVPSSSNETKRLQDRLAAANEIKLQLGEELSIAWKEIAKLKSQLASRTGDTNELAAAQPSPQETQEMLARQSTELAASRADASAARTELASVQSQFTAARQALAANTAAASAAIDAAAALESERTAHATTQAALAQLKTQLNELTAGRATHDREAAVRAAAAERAQGNAADEAKKWAAEKAELSGKADTLARELNDARAELVSVRQNSLAATARAGDAAVQSRQIAALEKKLSTSGDELNAAKTALAAASDAAAALERERTSHATTQAAFAQLKTQLNELTASRATLDREAAVRAAAVERAQGNAADEAKKWAAEKAELSGKADTLARELNDARAELVSVRQNSLAATARAGDAAAQSRQIAALEKKLSTSGDELGAAKTALAAAQSHTQSLESRAQAGMQAESQLTSLRNQVGILERDLQSATAASKRVAADNAGAETALSAANQKLADATKELTSLRQRAADTGRQLAAGADQKIAGLQGELNDAKSRLTAAEKGSATREEELAKLRAAVAAAQSRPTASATDLETARRAANEAQQRLAGVTQELAALHNQAAAARDLESRVRQLEAEKASLLSRPGDPDISKEEFARVAAAQTAAENKLSTALRSYTLLTKERDDLRAQAAAARELDLRVRQLESEKANLLSRSGDSNISKEEFARIAAAQADAENKLATALRSYALLTTERNELRARVADLSTKLSQATNR